MKKILNVFIISVIISIVCYLFSSFACATFDISKWQIGARVFTASFAFTAIVLVIGLYLSIDL